MGLENIPITVGFDHTTPVGRISLNDEVTNFLRDGVKFTLSTSMRMPEGTILEITLLPELVRKT